MEAIDHLTSLLQTELGDVEVSVDARQDGAGDAFIDISSEAFHTTITYRAGVGFGIYLSDTMYGQRPDELFRDTRKAAVRIAQLKEMQTKLGFITPLNLTQIRQLLDLTQNDVAQALSRDQSSVQRTEKRNNLQVDTLANFIKAMGGSVELRLVFKDMEANIPLKAAS